ncbi:hypothetical protein CCHL11_04225 [Colletotrichum chlorophyti]|uniref:C2H2-type domain-containing protein n=1 Tax=Colletotrichum chlorophyti TaxID=708187 RepID=A0A1Q8RLP3_9PEZI|nr:hypothetical protein CCHL11_04225 [Colletotrichum chlorophyti]
MASIGSMLISEPAVNHELEVRNIFDRVFKESRDTLPSPSSKEGILAYYAEAMVHLAKILKNASDDIVDEQRLSSTGHNIVDQAYRATGFNDMSILEFATKQRRMLSNMKEAIAKCVDSLEEIKECASPPSMELRRSEPQQRPVYSDPSSRSSFSLSAGASVYSAGASHTTSDSSRMYYASDRDPRSISPVSPPLDDDNDDDNVLEGMDLDDIDMESLRHRGKGEYICPYWKTCQKGGQDYNGRPRIFERNCMFRQHIQKHSKPHKCRLPGCPNKEGFARKDQLIRHQQNVKHDDLYPLPGLQR